MNLFFLIKYQYQYFTTDEMTKRMNECINIKLTKRFSNIIHSSIHTFGSLLYAYQMKYCSNTWWRYLYKTLQAIFFFTGFFFSLWKRKSEKTKLNLWKNSILYAKHSCEYRNIVFKKIWIHKMEIKWFSIRKLPQIQSLWLYKKMKNWFLKLNSEKKVF